LDRTADLYEFLNGLHARPTKYQVFTMAHKLRLYAQRLRKRRKKEIVMTIRDVMTKQVTTCRPETSLAAASALMSENDCGALPILAEPGELAGILTDRDICIALGTRNARASELTAREVIETHPVICKSTDDIRSALETMGEARIRRLPVVNDDGVLDGMVSIDDIVLGVKRGLGNKVGTALAYRDVATALQAICTRAGDDQTSNHPGC
jgi:CBS domain-containing protein